MTEPARCRGRLGHQARRSPQRGHVYALIWTLVVCVASLAPTPMAHGRLLKARKGATRDLRSAGWYASHGKCRKAIPLYNAAYSILRDPVILFNRGECYRELGRLNTALADYKRFLSVVPDAPNRRVVRQRIEELKKRAARRQKAQSEAKSAAKPASNSARERRTSERSRSSETRSIEAQLLDELNQQNAQNQQTQPDEPEKYEVSGVSPQAAPEPSAEAVPPSETETFASLSLDDLMSRREVAPPPPRPRVAPARSSGATGQIGGLPPARDPSARRRPPPQRLLDDELPSALARQRDDNGSASTWLWIGAGVVVVATAAAGYLLFVADDADTSGPMAQPRPGFAPP